RPHPRSTPPLAAAAGAVHLSRDLPPRASPRGLGVGHLGHPRLGTAGDPRGPEPRCDRLGPPGARLGPDPGRSAAVLRAAATGERAMTIAVLALSAPAAIDWPPRDADGLLALLAGGWPWDVRLALAGGRPTILATVPGDVAQGRARRLDAVVEAIA